MGKRVKFFYKGIQKLCPKCFGSDQIKNCFSQKVQGIAYKENLIASECLGRLIEILETAKTKEE
jgi:hypothetical protein